MVKHYLGLPYDIPTVTVSLVNVLPPDIGWVKRAAEVQGWSEAKHVRDTMREGGEWKLT